jgi:AcrR family transcriptional regulator
MHHTARITLHASPRRMQSVVKPRRRPLQSRAWMTTGAIQDAFVLLLVEQGYDKVAMREIATVAGVGLGTLYLYFPGKESIAAVTVRTRLRKLAASLAAAAETPVPRTLQQVIRALVAPQVQTLLGHADEWRALLYLERRISSAESYRELYREYVDLYRDALAAASDWPAGLAPQAVAFTAFSIVDAVVKQALLVQDSCPDIAAVAADVECAVTAYIDAKAGACASAGGV